MHAMLRRTLYNGCHTCAHKHTDRGTAVHTRTHARTACMHNNANIAEVLADRDMVYIAQVTGFAASLHMLRAALEVL